MPRRSTGSRYRNNHRRGQGGNSTEGLSYRHSNNTMEICINKYRIPADLYERYNERSQTRDAVVRLSKEYPITSRGFGFLVSKYFNYLKKRGNFDRINIHVFYRITLWQLELQLSNSEHYSSRRIGVDNKYLMPKENFYLIAAILGIVGKFTDQFHIEYTPIMCDRDPKTNKKIIYDQNNPPDPYTVSIRNLRDIVEFLRDARPEYQNAREYFCKNNPIPDAEWSENYVLQNADNIIPPEHSMMHDVNPFKDFMRELQRKFRFKNEFHTLIGTCLLDGSGDPAALASVEPKDGMALHNEDMTDTLLQFSGRVQCMIPLSGSQMLLGFIGLVGERPPYPERNDNWCIRSPYLSCRSVFYDNWIQKVDFIMMKYCT